MGKTYDEITPELAEWIEAQKLFFVATAPLAADGLVNCSPRGLDCFRILGPREVAWLDVTGSGAETMAHLRENGRIVLMFAAFEGAPKIVRLHGTGHVLPLGTPAFEALRDRFPALEGTRAIVRVEVTRIGDSCGWGVPRFTFHAERDTLLRWAVNKGPDAMESYRREKNAASLDGLPAWAPQDGAPAASPRAAAPAPVAAPAGIDLDRIVDLLGAHRQRATYGAVGGVLGVHPLSVMKDRPKDARHSWVVSVETGQPSGYEAASVHPELERRSLVLRTADQLASWLADPH